MDFDDHDEGDEEMEMDPMGSGYDTPRGGGGGGAGRVGGGEGDAGARKVVGGGGGRYRECLKNHAVSIGAHAVDGCGEFMAAGEEGTIDALRCAACSCHRNFHRKEAEGRELMAVEAGFHTSQFSPYYRTPAGYLHQHHHMAVAAAQQHHHRPPTPLALPSTSAGGEQEDVSNRMGGSGLGLGSGSGSGSGKKRFRTKFTQEQKEKMLAFAERVGWRIQKHDEAAVQQFCQEACVKRHVLKVWMHNNKHTLGKNPTTPPLDSSNSQPPPSS